MPFNIRMGVPEMAAVWADLSTRKLQGKLERNEERFFKKLVKVLGFLGADPRHPSLQTHEIHALTDKYGFKVFEAYLENRTPAAGRVFWAYQTVEISHRTPRGGTRPSLFPRKSRVM